MESLKACSSCGETKPIDWFHRNKTKRDGRTDKCKPCAISHVQKWTNENRDSALQRMRNWKLQNPGAFRSWYVSNRKSQLAKAKKYATENKERRGQSMRTWRSKNAERIRNSHRDWVNRNRDLLAARLARRKASKLKAIAKWGNRFFINETYRLAKLRTKTTGYAWHVDHIVPLQSKYVCGLHVEHNLRVIPGKLNASKRNRYWPDMPEPIHV